MDSGHVLAHQSRLFATGTDMVYIELFSGSQ
jgi:hypothetical protein